MYRKALAPAFARWQALLAFTLVEISGPWLLLGTRRRVSTARRRGCSSRWSRPSPLAALGYAVGPIIIDRKLKDVPPIGVVTASLILATALYAPFLPMLWPAQVTAAAVGSVAALGVLCTATAFMLFFALIAEVGPARATVVAYVNPLVAVALGVAVLGEPITLGMALGFPLVIAGSFLATRKAA